MFGDLISIGPIHASLIELVWIGAAIDLFRVSRLNHSEAIIDRVSLEGIQNGRRKMVDMNLYIARIFMIVAVLKLVIGVLAALLPAPTVVTPTGVLISGFLVVGLVAADLAMRSIRKFRLYINENGMQARDEHGKFTR